MKPSYQTTLVELPPLPAAEHPPARMPARAAGMIIYVSAADDWSGQNENYRTQKSLVNQRFTRLYM
jgi:hypothetical protein